MSPTNSTANKFIWHLALIPAGLFFRSFVLPWRRCSVSQSIQQMDRWSFHATSLWYIRSWKISVATWFQIQITRKALQITFSSRIKMRFRASVLCDASTWVASTKRHTLLSVRMKKWKFVGCQGLEGRRTSLPNRLITRPSLFCLQLLFSLALLLEHQASA